MKEFIITKNKFKKAENHPDYKLSVKVGDKWQEIGGAWLRDGKESKFFSCRLSNTSNYGQGFSIVADKKEQTVHGTVAYPETISPDSIPF